MRTNPINPTTIALALASVISLSARAQDDVTNRLSISARFGFNVSARFSGVRAPILQSPRTTPHGDNYNYDDGYVLRDSSRNGDGKTWYWGYDDSSAQVSGNNVLLSRTVASGPGSTMGDDPSFGAEILYTRMLGHLGRYPFGFEIAGNYLNMSLHDSSTRALNLNQTTDAYPFTPGTTPPTTTPDSPYQGSFNGPGFVIGGRPVSSSSTSVPGDATSTGTRSLDADVWGLRVGPYLEFPVSEKLKLSVSGGFAAALIDARASWRESITVAGVPKPTLKGSGTDWGLVFGGYIAGNAAWELNEHWSIVGSVQFQYLNRYSHDFSGRTVEADLTHGIFVTLGVGYKF